MKKHVLSLSLALCVVAVNTNAAGDPNAGAQKVATCAACHGPDGNSASGAFPSLAGQGSVYLFKQMQDVLSGARPIALMTGMLDNFSEEDLWDIAAFYESKEAKTGAVPEEQLELGKKIYEAGLADKGIAACSACHMANGQGNNPAGFPALSGQHAEYTLLQLKTFASGERNNDPAQMMRDIAVKMSEAEMEAVSAYIRGLY